MGIYHFPANFVYWEHVEDHEEIKKIFLDQIENIRNKTKDNQMGVINGSTNYGIRDDTIPELLADCNVIADRVVWTPIIEAIKQINSIRVKNPITLKESVICDAWFTEYKKGGFFEFHTHMNIPEYIQRNGKKYIPSFSLIYILHDKNKYNTTTFMNPFSMYISTENKFESIFNTRDINEIKEGTVLVFPSSLYHNIKSVEIPGRITVAINVASCHV